MSQFLQLQEPVLPQRFSGRQGRLGWRPVPASSPKSCQHLAPPTCPLLPVGSLGPGSGRKKSHHVSTLKGLPDPASHCLSMSRVRPGEDKDQTHGHSNRISRLGAPAIAGGRPQCLSSGIGSLVPPPRCRGAFPTPRPQRQRWPMRRMLDPDSLPACSHPLPPVAVKWLVMSPLKVVGRLKQVDPGKG